MNSCLFCNIISGAVSSHKIYEDDDVYVFLDINPVNIGHTLVIPKTHSEDIFSVDARTWGTVCDRVRALAPAVKAATGADGVNIVMNNKRSAGQLIDHVHIHIIPRFSHDGFKGMPQHPETEEALVGMREKIIERLRGS